LEVGLFNPFAGRVDADLGIAFGNLFDGDDDLHDEKLSYILTDARERRLGIPVRRVVAGFKDMTSYIRYVAAFSARQNWKTVSQ
jgi:hypothetical protein